MRITIARTWQEAERLGPAWDRLYRPAAHTLFQSFRWNLLAARCFGQRCSPLLVYAEASAGAALIPACASSAGLELLGEQLFDYRDILAAGHPDVARAAWQALARTGRSFSLTAVRGPLARARWTDAGFAPQPFVAAPQVRDISADAFGHQHHRSARFLRRLARAGVSLRQHSGGESDLVRRVYELKGAQLDTPNNLFSDPVRRDFMVAAAAQHPGCEIFTLETPGTLVAALLTLRDHHVRRFYTTYYDRAWAHESPGTALLLEITRRSLEQGLDCDYMTGEQPHKMRFATAAVPLFRVHASAGELHNIARGARLLAA